MQDVIHDGRPIEMASIGECAGRHLGYTAWRKVTQEQVDRFADITNDHNFIHVDPQRARETPFGGTIAHGFLTLALVAEATQRLNVSDAKTTINYGLEKVRFPAPLPVGAQWRAGAEVIDVSDIPGGAQTRMRATVEVKDSERPAAVAECLIRFYA
ncbi:MAG: MaoC family dehydratase [Solirubrobacteraceae bacterium]